MNILKKLQSQDRTLIIITHDNDIAAQAQRIIKIKDGKIEADYINPDFVPYGQEAPTATNEEQTVETVDMNETAIAADTAM